MDDIQRLLARQAIQDTLVRYAHALDSRQTELFDDVFLADADLDYTAAGGIRGDRAALRGWLGTAMARFDSWQHLLSNFIIDTDGETATTTTSCYNPLQGRHADGSGHVVHTGCHYLDQLRKTPAGWRITKRTLVLDWTDPTDVVG